MTGTTRPAPDIKCVMGHDTLCKHATVKIASPVFSGTAITAILLELEFDLIPAAGQTTPTHAEHTHLSSYYAHEEPM